MFSDPEVADLAPISMIILNLAARAYDGQTDLCLALRNIVEKSRRRGESCPARTLARSSLTPVRYSDATHDRSSGSSANQPPCGEIACPGQTQPPAGRPVRAWGLRGGRVRVHSPCRDDIGRR
jgi:hypothetical protein